MRYFKHDFGDDFLKKNLKQFVAWLMCIEMIILTGCGNSSSTTDTSSTSTKKDYDIFVYNSDTDIGTDFRAMCDEYTSRTGIIIRTVTPTESDATVDNLSNYLSGENPPDIFTVSSLSELQKWKSSSNIWDFSNATEDSFKEVVNNIPESLRLSSNTTDSFGLPYTVEAYGFVADPKMLSSLFGGDKYRTVLNDLQECSYEEFASMIQALQVYINSSGISEFTLNGNQYSFVSSKGDLSKNLNGAFSFAAGAAVNSGTYLTNIALASLFKSAAAANIADNSTVESLENPLIKFAQTLDMITLNVTGSSGLLGRGSELTSSSQNSTGQAMKNFVNGKSLFLLASTNDYDNLSIFDSLFAKRCVFIPIKMPFGTDDIKSSTTIAKNMQRSITVYVPRYYCINANSSSTEKKKAQDFLTWVKTSDLASKYVISDFGFTPYDITESSVIDNPLSRSMVDYISSGHILPPAFQGAPVSWCNDTMGKYLIEQFFTKASWSYSDYQTIADYGVKEWKALKGT
jgi:raffinose/stachyose/melibiose transport system substrate-binding protein